MKKDGDAPETVSILYRKAGTVHIFTSVDLRGLHVGDANLKRAFDMIPEAVSGLVELTFGEKAEYEPELSCEEFKFQLASDSLSPVLKVKMGHHAQA